MIDKDIVSITRSLRRSHTFSRDATQAVFLAYLDVIEDIEITILERIKENHFEDPDLVARITAYFIEEIAGDIDKPASRFLALVEKFALKKPGMQKGEGLGLLGLGDLLVNYMADLEDHLRANAMARCGRRELTRNDRDQIVLSMTSAIYPHCKPTIFPKNTIGSAAKKIFEGVIKLGISYECTKHLNRSISIRRTL